MILTPRDLAILDKVYKERACEEGALLDFFPSRRAMRQRLWRLVRHRFLLIRRDGDLRAYILGPAGARTLGVSEGRRGDVSSVRRLLLYAQVRTILLSEGFAVEAERQEGGVRIMDARRGPVRVAVAVCDGKVTRRQLDRLTRFLNPFGGGYDSLVVFTKRADALPLGKLPPGYRGRVVLKRIPAA